MCEIWKECKADVSERSMIKRNVMWFRHVDLIHEGSRVCRIYKASANGKRLRGARERYVTIR